MSSKSIYDVREDEIDIEDRPWNDSTVQQLAWKNIYLVQKQVDFWQPYLDRGQSYFDMYDGKILTDTQRSSYENVEDKIVIEPPIAKAPIRALVGHSINARKSGSIEVEEGDLDNPNRHANEVQTIDICMKHLEKKSNEAMKIRDAMHDSMVSCYPNVVLYQRRRPTLDNPLKYNLFHPAWNSCVFGPVNFMEPDLSDLREVSYFRNYSMAELIELFPDMEDNITAHWSSTRKDDKQLSSLLNWDDYLTAKDLSWLNSIYNAAYGSLAMPGGLMPTFMRMFQMKKKQEVWIKVNEELDENSQDFEHVVIPRDWSKKRKERYLAENKGKLDGPYEREINVLWQCVVTNSGLMLQNKLHWFQNYGNFPGAVFVPCLVSGKPSGPMEDMSAEVLRNCVAEIEYLDDLRKGDGELMVVRGGAFTKDSLENLASEVNKAHGISVINDKFKGPIDAAYKVERRQPSQAWRDYGDHTKSNMEENTRINSTMQGESAPRQSNVAKQNEIGAALGVSALYFDNFNRQWENLQNVKLSLIPYIYDESNMRVEAFIPKENVNKATMLNVPQYDMTGEQSSVLNDVTSARYKWMISPVDDSPTAKARQMHDAILIINGSAGPLMQSDPTGKLLSSFWQALDNPIINEAGKRLAADSQMRIEAQSAAQKEKSMKDAQAVMVRAMADLEKAKKAGVSLSFTGEQMAQYPALRQYYQSILQQSAMTEQAIVGHVMEEGNQPPPPANPQPPPPANPQQPQPGQGEQGSGVPADQMAPVAAQ